MIAYLTVEKMNDKWKGRGISEKISLTKSYTTIGGMDHHDVKVPFSVSAAYLSIHEDEEGNYYLSAYDIPVFINDRKITESICLRDKDHIRIGEDYTFGFNQIKPVNVVPKKADPPKEPIKIAALKPSKSALMKKTAVLEQMKNIAAQSEAAEKKAPSSEPLSARLEPEKPTEGAAEKKEKEPKTDEATLSSKETPTEEAGPSMPPPPDVVTTNEQSEPTQQAQAAEGQTASAQPSEPSEVNAVEEHSTPSLPTPEKQEEPDSLEKKGDENSSLSSGMQEPSFGKEPLPKKVDLSLRDKRGQHTFRKQKVVVRVPEHVEEGKKAETTSQPPSPTPTPNDQAQMVQWQQAIQNLISEPNANLSSEQNALEDSKKVITTWKQTLQNLIEPQAEKPQERFANPSATPTLEVFSNPESAPANPNGQELLDSWKKALYAIMEQAKEAEASNVSPEDSRDLITNWKETLEGLMEQAGPMSLVSNETPFPPQTPEAWDDPMPQDTEDPSAWEARQEETIEESSKEMTEAPEASLEPESIEDPTDEKGTWEEELLPSTASSVPKPQESGNEKRSEILASWKETLQNLVERNYKEKTLESESKILAEKISRAKASLSESKVLGMRPEKAPGDSKVLGTKLDKTRESDVPKAPPKPLTPPSLQTERRSMDSLRSEAFSNTRQIASLTKSMPEPEMTLMWEAGNVSDTPIQRHPKLISPSSGEILSLEKDFITIGRSASCDMCLVDDYISRQHLELKKIPLGFLVKNVGKNEVFIEKRSQQTPSFEGKIALEQKVLKPGESSLLLQEATIMIGKELLYYFSIPESQDVNAENQIRERKFGFYKNLAKQKKELLDAAQLQKSLIPPKVVFEDLGLGVWFKYMAINDLSGDFFLYHREEDALYFCLGDVSGHGAAAALMASQISGMFRILAEHQASVEGIMDSINQNLFRAKRRTHNLYALVNVLKVTADGIELCIAGNSVPPLYYSDARQELISLSTPSTPTGLFTSTHFRTYLDVLKFEKNDMLIMFTDGVTEAEMIDGALLEYHRAEEYIKNQIRQRQSWEFFLDNFLTWVKQHCEIRDDLSIVLIGKLDQ